MRREGEREEGEEAERGREGAREGERERERERERDDIKEEGKRYIEHANLQSSVQTVKKEVDGESSPVARVRMKHQQCLHNYYW